MEQIKLTRGDYHEMTDRLHIVGMMVEDHLLKHQVAQHDEEIGKPLEAILEQLAELYQIAGGKLFGVYE
jgi:hypothetical protein